MTFAPLYATPGFAVPGAAGLGDPGSGAPPNIAATLSGSGTLTATGTVIPPTAPAGLFIAVVIGDNTTAGQVFQPAGWTPLAQVTTSNGTDHTCDVVLTAATYDSSAAASVTATSVTAEDMAGFMTCVLLNGNNPIPAAQNPNWPYMKFEAAFGGGFQTPPDQLTWTDLTTRCWSWDETTGIQFQLGQIQATNLDMELDNFDGALSSDNTAGPYYPNVTTGTPVRLRAAIGTIGGVTVNRWYVISRNAQEWPQRINDIYRRYAPATGTDIWSAMSVAGPSPFRGEILQETSLYSWYPMDDQPLPGGVLPTALGNAAPGNTTALTIHAASGGVIAGAQYTTDGINSTTGGGSGGTPLPSVATYAVGQQAGWMFGDPQSSPAYATSGGTVTASPGSAAWQQTGLLGSGGSNGWFMAVNDTGLPGLSGGMTFELWFNAAFFGTSSGWFEQTAGTYHVLAGQPYSQITLATLATNSAPVAILYLDLSGHLILETFNGGTGTTHTIYSGSDLRSASWHQVMFSTNGSSWTVYLDGGSACGGTTATGTSAGMTSAWTWLVTGADLGFSGGSSLSSATHMGNVAYSHAIVFSSILPAWRVTAHYCAAATAFGLIPAPQTLALTSVENEHGTAWTPDGTLFQGSYGASVTTFTFSGLAVANIGSYTSGPSARATIAGIGQDVGGIMFAAAVFMSWTGLAPQFTTYTSASAATETSASTADGSGDAFSSGYGSGATASGACHTGSGSGASPPSSPSSLGDTPGQRIERVLGYSNVSWPGRCIDPATLLVQAATDTGGQQAGQNCENIAQSDGGLLYVDSQNNLTYWSKTHLAGQYSSPVWTLGPTATGTVIPYYREDFKWTEDPQRLWNAIEIQPFSPDGTQLPVVTPTATSSVLASQKQYGAQPLLISSYLQSQSEMQSQANFLFTNYGAPTIWIDGLKVDAAPASQSAAAWQFVLSASIGDIITVQNWQIGGGGNTGTFRISNIKRRIEFGGQSGNVAGRIEIQASYEPSSYWS